MCANKLIHHSLTGGTDQACRFYNQMGMADFVLNMQFTGMGAVVTILKVPNEKVPAVWRKLGRDPLTCPIQPERT